MKNVLLLIIVLGLTFLSSPAIAQNSIRAEGMATIHKNFVDIARDRAIENAQRTAVEQAVGVMITSKTEVENYQVKLDQILAESEGFINSYRVVSEKREGDTYKVSIEADVGMGKLRNRLAAVDLIVARKSKPRMMVIFTVKAQKDAIAEAAISKYFLAQGFKLVDADVSKNNKEFERLYAASDDQKTAVTIAHRYGAEVLLVGRVEITSNKATISGIEMNSNNVIVSGKAINGDTGEVITTGSENKSAAGTQGDIREITEEASKKLAAKLMDDVLARWSSEVTNLVTVKLLVSGLNSYQELMQFKELLTKEIKGYKEAHQRSYYRGQVDLDVELRGNAQGLADDVAAMSLNKKTVRILEITPNRIKAKVQP